MAYKQVILVRSDLKLPKGKLAAQVAHASTEAMLAADRDAVDEWRQNGAKKVVLKVKDEAELLKFKQLAGQQKLRPVMITDAGRTVLEPGTTTCLGIGPVDEDILDKLTGSLKML